MSIFNKPVHDITFQDIQELVNNKDPEILNLDYKREVKPNDDGKKDLAKDVSAFANTEGGWLIIGVDEKASSICGTLKVIGTGKTEEWIDNVLSTCISPKPAINIIPIAIPANTDKQIIVIRVPKSPRRPHMSRIDKKYYIRRSTKSEPAEEYEVRWMFESGMKDMETLSQFLKSRHLVAESDSSNTRLVSLLVHNLCDIRKEQGMEPQAAHVIFAVCPKWLEERTDVTSAEFEKWLESRRETYKHFIAYGTRLSLDSLLSLSWYSQERNYLEFYTEIFRNGYIETGICEKLFFPYEKTIWMNLTYFAGVLMDLLRFTQELCTRSKYQDDLSIIVSFYNIQNVGLCGFGPKNKEERWQEPNAPGYHGTKPVCLHNGIRIERAALASELTDGKIIDLGRYFAKRVSNAFDLREAMCFDDYGNFNYGWYKSF